MGRAGRGCQPLDIERALARDELAKPGVYVLTAAAGAEGAQRVYVGQTNDLQKRLKQQLKKDFWEDFVAFSSSNTSVHRAIAEYLESRLISLAKAAKQWVVENDQAPPLPQLPEALQADAEGFLAEMLIILPLLDIDAFEDAASQVRGPSADMTNAAPELVLRERGADARGREVADGFVVLQGSRARRDEVGSIYDHLSELRRQLVERGVLVVEGDGLAFTQDYRFTSPSKAAGVLVGSSANGLQAWKDLRGTTLKALRDARARTAK